MSAGLRPGPQIRAKVTPSPHSELRESLAVGIQDVLLIDSPEGDSPRNIASNLREVLRDLDGLVEQLQEQLETALEQRDLLQERLIKLANWYGHDLDAALGSNPAHGAAS